MAAAIYGGLVPACNTVRPFRAGHDASHPDLVDHPHLTPEVQVALLAAIEETGDASLGDLAGAVPGCERPISAVLALVDAGILILDVAAPFDASCRVRRAVRARN